MHRRSPCILATLAFALASCSRGEAPQGASKAEPRIEAAQPARPAASATGDEPHREPKDENFDASQERRAGQEAAARMFERQVLEPPPPPKLALPTPAPPRASEPPAPPNTALPEKTAGAPPPAIIEPAVPKAAPR